MSRWPDVTRRHGSAAGSRLLGCSWSCWSLAGRLAPRRRIARPRRRAGSARRPAAGRRARRGRCRRRPRWPGRPTPAARRRSTRRRAGRPTRDGYAAPLAGRLARPRRSAGTCAVAVAQLSDGARCSTARAPAPVIPASTHEAAHRDRGARGRSAPTTASPPASSRRRPAAGRAGRRRRPATSPDAADRGRAPTRPAADVAPWPAPPPRRCGRRPAPGPASATTPRCSPGPAVNPPGSRRLRPRRRGLADHRAVGRRGPRPRRARPRSPTRPRAAAARLRRRAGAGTAITVAGSPTARGRAARTRPSSPRVEQRPARRRSSSTSWRSATTRRAEVLAHQVGLADGRRRARSRAACRGRRRRRCAASASPSPGPAPRRQRAVPRTTGSTPTPCSRVLAGRRRPATTRSCGRWSTGLPVAGFTGSLAYRFDDGAGAGRGHGPRQDRHADRGPAAWPGWSPTGTATAMVFVLVADRVAWPTPSTPGTRWTGWPRRSAPAAAAADAPSCAVCGRPVGSRP